MRWPLLFILIPLAACSQIQTIPAPWEPTERQNSEPQPVADAVAPSWTTIGTSIRGKPIEAVTLGSGPRRVYIIGGIHGDDPEGPAVASKLPLALVPDFVSKAGEKCTVRIVRDMNPDGSALKTRDNTRGVDLNRNWPSRDFQPDPKRGKRPLSELETTAVQKDLLAFKPELVIVFQTAVSGRGPDVSMEGAGPTLAYEFASSARTVDPRWRVDLNKRYRTPGSVESYVGRDLKVPVLNIDFRRGEDSQLSLKAIRTTLVEYAINLPESKVAPKPAAKSGQPAPKAAAKPLAQAKP
jgi:hypothetical protein